MSLILSQIQAIHKQHRAVLITILMNSIYKLVEIEVNCTKYKWLSATMCVKSKSVFRKLSSSLEFNRVSSLTDSQNAYKSLTELALNLLDTYGVASDEFSEARTIEEHLTLLATNILKDVFRNCLAARELICKNLLNACTTSYKDPSVFISSSFF